MDGPESATRRGEYSMSICSEGPRSCTSAIEGGLEQMDSVGRLMALSCNVYLRATTTIMKVPGFIAGRPVVPGLGSSNSAVGR